MLEKLYQNKIILEKEFVKKILVIEDEDYRLNWFKERLAGIPTDYAKDKYEGIALISKNKYDLIFWDHDLGGPKRHLVPSTDPDTSWHIAKFMKEVDNPNLKAGMIIHTHNDNGAQNIISLIGGVRMIFYSFDIEIK